MLPPTRATIVTSAFCVLVGGFLISGHGYLLILMFLLCIPSILYGAWVSRMQRIFSLTNREIKQIGYCYLVGIFPCPLFATIIQAILLPIFIIICFYDQKDEILQQFDLHSDDNHDEIQGSQRILYQWPTKQLHIMELPSIHIEKTIGFYIFLVIFAYIIAALVEEWLKLWIVKGTCCYTIQDNASNQWSQRCLCHPKRLLYNPSSAHKYHSMVVIMAVAAGALGVSFAENIMYTITATTRSDQVWTAATRSIISTPLHTICGALTGAQLAKSLPQTNARFILAKVMEDESKLSRKWYLKWIAILRLLFPAMIIHGTFDFVLLLQSAFFAETRLEEHYPYVFEIIVPGGLGIVLIIGGINYLLKITRHLQITSQAIQYSRVAVDLESGQGQSRENDELSDDDTNIIN